MALFGDGSLSMNVLAGGTLLQLLPLSFATGAGASLASCTILRLPVAFGYSAASAGSQKRALIHTLAFSLGLIISFTLLGIAFSSISGLARSAEQASRPIYWVWGILLIGAGALFAGLIPSRASWLRDRCGAITARINNVPSAFVFGMAFAVLELPSCPCCGAALVGIAGLSFLNGAVFQSALLFASYAAGQSMPLIVAGLSTGMLRREQLNIRRAEAYMNIVAGNLLIVTGLAFMLLA
ncbi:MAG: sulfite exporter TauE/SafE family protein [Nitrospinae bacterium]|nr:sulfite exporter TauE/SafE family protein [Nitrospinota bacterium]